MVGRPLNKAQGDSREPDAAPVGEPDTVPPKEEVIRIYAPSGAEYRTTDAVEAHNLVQFQGYSPKKK